MATFTRTYGVHEMQKANEDRSDKDYGGHIRYAHPKRRRRKGKRK